VFPLRFIVRFKIANKDIVIYIDSLIKIKRLLRLRGVFNSRTVNIAALIDVKRASVKNFNLGKKSSDIGNKDRISY